jgi:hypothetical protein
MSELLETNILACLQRIENCLYRVENSLSDTMPEFIKTEFKLVPVQNASLGVPLGLGKCKAVRLKLNAFPLDDGSNYVALPNYIYYGDAQSQQIELMATDLANTSAQDGYSPLIYCRDLSEVFIRYNTGQNPVTVYLNVLVYS